MKTPKPVSKVTVFTKVTVQRLAALLKKRL